MCGIAGYIGGRRNKELLLSMISQLEHRGPDGFGYYMDEQAGLAHARLSIIDVEGGAQPLTNENGTIWITFNGEIYNYIELRANLEEQGHFFKTQSDTEVIIHAYEEYGMECFPMLNGQFAIAIWDSVKEIGLLVRDRVGIQPLFFSWDKSTCYFASEVKALFANPNLRNGLNRREIANVFTYWSPSMGETVFNNVFEVSPGHINIIRNGSIDEVMYWDHDYTEKEQEYDLYHYLNNAINLRLRSDVPVAAYLSGGLDSSVISLLAKRNTDKLNTFSIQFEDAQYDESKYQQQVASAFNIEHTPFTCSTKDIADNFDNAVFYAEKPLFRTAPVPMYLLSQQVKRAGYKVVLTGEGADEVFAGYDIFRETAVRKEMLGSKSSDTGYINQLLLSLYPWMSDKMLTSNSNYLKQFFGSSSTDSNLFWFSHEPRIKTSSKSHLFFADDMESLVAERFFQYLEDNKTADSLLKRAQYIEFKTLFSGYLISSQGDRMLMANGVEGRFPFLDPNVVSFGDSLIVDDKVRIGSDGEMVEKAILKRLANRESLFPQDIIDRPKQPYMAPDVNAFMLDNGFWHESVGFALTKDYGYFDMRKIDILANKFQKGLAKGFSENMAFMGFLSTQLLHHSMVENYQPQPTVADMTRFQIKVEK